MTSTLGFVGWCIGQPTLPNTAIKQSFKSTTFVRSEKSYSYAKNENQFFTAIGPKLASSIPPAQHKYEVDKFEKSLVLNYTNELENSKIVAILKNKKSSGHDGISNEILKSCSPIIKKY